MLPNRITLGLPPKEKLFVMLVGVLGVPAGKAYQDSGVTPHPVEKTRTGRA